MVLPALYFGQSQARWPAALRQRPGPRLEVQGHTDNQGSAELNHQLSQQRAEVVCLYPAPTAWLRSAGGPEATAALRRHPARR
ncbi:OmpA family protein [uncultured Hymenobacter sp.]|uniref:OmpA family protein n=1 Tax=uncultured Hymenobacter sp. TaxID=170016 RepID=UPI0035C9EB03